MQEPNIRKIEHPDNIEEGFQDMLKEYPDDIFYYDGPLEEQAKKIDPNWTTDIFTAYARQAENTDAWLAHNALIKKSPPIFINIYVASLEHVDPFETFIKEAILVHGPAFPKGLKPYTITSEKFTWEDELNFLSHPRVRIISARCVENVKTLVNSS